MEATLLTQTQCTKYLPLSEQQKQTLKINTSEQRKTVYYYIRPLQRNTHAKNHFYM